MGLPNDSCSEEQSSQVLGHILRTEPDYTTEYLEPDNMSALSKERTQPVKGVLPSPVHWI